MTAASLSTGKLYLIFILPYFQVEQMVQNTYPIYQRPNHKSEIYVAYVCVSFTIIFPDFHFLSPFFPFIR
jgi:hypothetical protein